MSHKTPLATATEAGQIIIAGDVGGSATSLTVSKINGALVPAAGSLTTGHVLTVTGSSALTYAFLTNTNIDSSAGIAGSKINPDFANQNITTTGQIISPTHVVGSSGASNLTAGTGAPGTTPPDGSLFLRTDGTSGSNGLYTRQGGAWFTVGGTGSFSAGGDLTGNETSQQVVSLTGSSGTINIASTGAILNWATGSSAPTLKQADNSTGSATGQSLTVQAQNATGATSNGGSLVLTSGTGTTAAGNLIFSTGGTVRGRLYNTGGLAVGNDSQQDTSSEAQAGLTGPLINIGSSTGTMTSATNQMLLFNQSGAAHIQGNTDVRFDVAANLAGYFDVNRTFRIGATPSTAASILGGSNNAPSSTDAMFVHNSAGGVTTRMVSATTSTSSIIQLLNNGDGSSATTGLIIYGNGSAHSITAFRNNSVLEQVGGTSSGLVFTSLTSNASTRTFNGRLWQSGAWSIGDATNNDTSSEAQAGLTGPMINLAVTTGGTLTTTSNQAVIYNNSGTLRLQGNTSVEQYASTTLVTGISTTAVTISVAGLNYANTVSSPTFKQNDNTTNGATAQNLTIQAQNATGTTSTGGDLLLKSGSGTSANGKVRLQVDGTELLNLDATNISLFNATGSFGSGSRVLFIANATTSPTTDPSGGGIMYVSGGALFFRGSSGTVTQLAPA